MMSNTIEAMLYTVVFGRGKVYERRVENVLARYPEMAAELAITKDISENQDDAFMFYLSEGENVETKCIVIDPDGDETVVKYWYEMSPDFYFEEV